MLYLSQLKKKLPTHFLNPNIVKCFSRFGKNEGICGDSILWMYSYQLYSFLVDSHFSMISSTLSIFYLHLYHLYLWLTFIFTSLFTFTFTSLFILIFTSIFLFTFACFLIMMGICLPLFFPLRIDPGSLIFLKPSYCFCS